MRKRHPFHGGARSARDTEATRGRGPTRGLGSERGPGSAQGTIPTVPAQYVIGPIDPAQLLTLQVRLPNDQQICLLVPARLPHSVLNRTLFSEGCRWGCFASEDEAEAAAREERSVPKLLNSISLALHAELWGERNRDDYAWVIGFLLGKLTSLAATERMLALVGFAHLRFL